ncbi:HAD family hydrolase [Lachnoclostridium phytofermentans]|uniref:HAD family hydrolase n=1 Tax=Lachnoclostridium phytofermentans TaxID=66219 RepID=UPI00068F0B16|nr:HAD family hydrolase [Lachnoclostridium phytofermentans]
MFKNIIFDFDGVIINSHDVQVKALTESYKVVCGNGTPPYDDFFRLSGDSLKNIFEQLNLPQAMVPIYQQISRDNIDLIKIHVGMSELLRKLNESGCKCALCTGKDRSRTIEILQYYNLEKYFMSIVCSDDVQNPKPHPESLLYIMKKLNALKDNTIMVGDGINDILAAKNTGIKSIAVTWGDIPGDILVDYKPTYVANTVFDLMTQIYDGRESNEQIKYEFSAIQI